jgi:two-component system sensor histidine kinase KdpD
MLFDVDSGAIHCTAEGRDLALETLTRRACLEDRDAELPQANTWVRVLRLDGRAIGSLGLRGKEFSALTTQALASLAAISLQRARSFEAESRAIAEKRAEELRTAVLDSLAHDFKTPLTVIRTASNGLLAMDGLIASQREMLSLVDHEATKLTEITTQLLRASRLEKRVTERTNEPYSSYERKIFMA